jgi:stearoyl-CoA desaturase (delta-9 desaturase)
MRNGFFWWEWDPSFYVVRALSWIGLASDLRSAPPALLERSRVRNNWDVGMHGPEPKPVAAARQKASEMAHLLIDSAKATRERRPVPTPAD